jgi:hypothetical protein
MHGCQVERVICCGRAGASQVPELYVQPEVETADELVVAEPGLEVLADHVDVLEVTLEQVAPEDRGGPGGVVDRVDDLDRRPDGVRGGETELGPPIHADRAGGVAGPPLRQFRARSRVAPTKAPGLLLRIRDQPCSVRSAQSLTWKGTPGTVGAENQSHSGGAFVGLMQPPRTARERIGASESRAAGTGVARRSVRCGRWAS